MMKNKPKTKIYSEWKRFSHYVIVRDGTRLAMDIYHPTMHNKMEVEPLPVIWTHHRYRRVIKYLFFEIDIVKQLPWLKVMLNQGYIVAAVDVRGSGASFGTREIECSKNEAQDAYDITEWLASQEWCNGNIGMYGRSYLGVTQLFAASQTPPHLKAIMPEMTPFSIYDNFYPGGILRNDYVNKWGDFIHYLDTTAPSKPVDSDRDRSLLHQAQKEHLRNMNFPYELPKYPHRNNVYQDQSKPFLEMSPDCLLREINDSHVAVYHIAGWNDGYPKEQLLCYKNLTTPKKITIYPHYHYQNDIQDLGLQHLRWYDYWLKGIENGVRDEAPIRYYVMNANKGRQWRTSNVWPLEKEQRITFFFKSGPSKSVSSINDGVLEITKSENSIGVDNYTVDYSATTGKATRWTALYMGPFGYPDMQKNDRKALTYTLEPTQNDIEVTGHPVVHLWITSSYKDGDFFVYLEDVNPSGYSRYITEGVLRASHRKLDDAPYDYLNLPYHRSFHEDDMILPEKEPVELVFDLLPISIIIKRGHRIRIAITCSDKDNYETPRLLPPPTIKVYRNVNYPSCITLPIIE